MTDLKIYIYSHTDFTPPVTSDRYEILSEVPITHTKLKQHDVTTGDNIQKLGPAYGELKGLYWVWKNIQDLPDYIGFVHYSRYFSFLDDIPEIEELFGDAEIIAPTKYKSNVSLVKQYAIGHNVSDLIECCIISCKSNNEIKYMQSVTKTLNSHNIYFCNAFIMKKQDFIEYCEWLFNILFTFDKRHNIYCYDDVIRYVNDHEDLYRKPMYDLKYQYRLNGFIGERLFNVWINYKHKKIKDYEFRKI